MLGVIAIIFIGNIINKRLEERQASTEEFKLSANVFENAFEAIIITDADGIIMRANKAFSTITGYTNEEVIGQKPNILKSDHHPNEFYREMWVSILNNKVWQGEIWNRCKDGRIIACWQNISSVRDSKGKILYFIGTFNDITEKKQSEERIKYLAHYDILTSLPNRALFNDRIQHTLNLAKRNNTTFALLFLDIDDFKKINDSMGGHASGDKLLIQLGERLTNALRPSDTVARLGGDEFTIILENFKSYENVAYVAQKLIKKTIEPFIIDQAQLFVTCSIGISLYPDDGGDNVNELFQHADTAMYRAKETGRISTHSIIRR